MKSSRAGSRRGPAWNRPWSVAADNTPLTQDVVGGFCRIPSCCGGLCLRGAPGGNLCRPPRKWL